MIKPIFLSMALAFGGLSAQSHLPIIPFPKEISMSNGHFLLDKNVSIVSANKSFETEYLQRQLSEQFGISLNVKSKAQKGKNIILSIDKNLKDEQYTFTSSDKNIVIKGRSGKELFYGIQTLLQLVPADSKNTAKIASVNIKDEPTFGWRGMHLDVGRHYFPVEFIKKYIDFLAMYKMNIFHWHLTEDQGWRLEIKKYPRLTEVGAWRNRSMVGHYNENRYQEGRYGGFYTQAEAREIVKYAAQRHITVIPEIELPGHSTAAVAAYPQYGCTGKQIEVATKWGVFEDIYCPSEETFKFLEDVLTEVMDIFPSKIIHIGGDEAPKEQWKASALAQEVIKREGLKDEHELQSYFIQRIEKFLNKHGRQIIGWDEILEGGLAPNAKVMSWRGFEGGIEAAKQHHDVVMTPGDFVYFDHYQGNPKNEPVAIGGYTTVEKVYSFNPIPKSLNDKEKKFILGAQGNVWTEYMPTTQHVEYMVFPRITALTEVLWGTNKNYNEFQERLFQHLKVLDKKKINYSKAIFEVTTESKMTDDKSAMLLTLKALKKDGEVRFTTDGTEPTVASPLYQQPIRITENKTIKAAYFENGVKKSATAEQSFNVSKTFGKDITLAHQPSEKYYDQGAITLVNGIKGDRGKFGKDWLGFNGKDLDAVIDFGKTENFSNFEVGLIHGPENWIYYPKSIEILVSNDGKNFTSAKNISEAEIKQMNGNINVNIGNQNARFVKVFIKNHGTIAQGNPGAGNPAWLFADEILIK